jgi:hypothetical protein
MLIGVQVIFARKKKLLNFFKDGTKHVGIAYQTKHLPM